MNLFARKPVSELQCESRQEHGLRRALGPANLVMLGIGGIIGAGIFVLTGQAAAQYAGPAIAISFIISGLGCVFAGMCYAEFAAMIPIAGSAYTYAYATLGEFIAWIIGWDLILEYLFCAPTVAVGWSGYFQSMLAEFNVHVPFALSTAPIAIEDGHFVATGAICNLPAVGIILFLSLMLYIGIKKSAVFNGVMVFTKVGVLLAVIAFGVWYLAGHPAEAAANWTPFIPANEGKFGEFGWSGIFKGAAVIFFAYIGFDAVSTSAQESKNPQRDMPVGILGSLLVCTVIFITLSLVLTGLMDYTQLKVPAPVVTALEHAGAPAYFQFIVEIAAIAGLSSVIMVMLMGQTRIFFTMAHDGLLPPIFARVHPRFGTPYVTTIFAAIGASIVAAVLPLSLLGELVSIGTLFAFVIVSASVIVLRRTQPDVPRPFRTPWVPLIPILGIIVCLAQMFSLPGDTWLRLIGWLAIGLVVYFTYGIRHSKLTGPKRA